MKNYNDLVGQKFKKWTIIEYVYMKKFQAHGYLLKCECGKNYSTQMRSRLIKGTHTNQCGPCKDDAISKASFKKNYPAMFNCWRGMKTNSKHKGINICDDWKSFHGFYKDMGEKPYSTRLTRIDQKGNFEKSNCYWKKINRKDYCE